MKKPALKIVFAFVLGGLGAFSLFNTIYANSRKQKISPSTGGETEIK
jgi:hypothetical protein